MGRYFNTEGQCEPEIHYMVRLDERLEQIKRFFIIRESISLSIEADNMGKLQHCVL